MSLPLSLPLFFFCCCCSISHFSFPRTSIVSLTKSCLNNSNKRHSSPLCLQSRRCSDGRDPPAARHRQLCQDGAPGCTAVPGLTAPHRPRAHIRICGSKKSPDSELAQTELQVHRLKIFQIEKEMWEESGLLNIVIFLNKCFCFLIFMP